MKVAIYARTSTDKDQNPQTQIRVIEKYLENLEGVESIRTYIDEAVSGSKASRPEFDKMLTAMRNREINTIAVYKLDRIGRSLSHLVSLFEEFKKKNIKFISATQSINTASAEGRMFLQMMMVIAEFEREMTRQRVIDGMARARAEGKKIGRPKGSTDKKQRRKSGYYLRWRKS